MGRPLKIQKYSPGSGEGAYAPGQPVRVDQGFNMWSQLTNPVYPVTMTSSNFEGVVGGANAIGGVTVASSAYPVVKCSVYVAGDDQVRDGFIIRQKGATKYLVAAINAIADDNLVVGSTYIINSVGTTNWQLFGGPANAQAGDIFTCTVTGSNSGTGNVFLVSTCALVDKSSPAAGEMNITMNVNDNSTQIRISKLTNKFALDYSTPPVRYATNFFTDEGTVIKSGTGYLQPNTASQQNTMYWGQVENYTS